MTFPSTIQPGPLTIMHQERQEVIDGGALLVRMAYHNTTLLKSISTDVESREKGHITVLSPSQGRRRNMMRPISLQK